MCFYGLHGLLNLHFASGKRKQKVLVRSNLQIRTSTSGWNNYLHALFCKYVQAHLAGIILVTKSLNLIGNTWFYDLEQLQNTSPTNQKSTEAIFLQFENNMRGKLLF